MASYSLRCNLPDNRRNMENIVAAADPDAFFKEEGKIDYQIEIFVTIDSKGIACRGKIGGLQQAEISFIDTEIINLSYSASDYEQRKKEVVRRGILELLNKIGTPKLPWGILTGVRPTKIYHYLRDLGFSSWEVKNKLEGQFLLSTEKALLLAAVGETQRPWLKAAAKKISVYIGIPFCPTKCGYCSFASYPLATHSHLIKGFLEALAYEIKAIGKALQLVDLPLVSLYIGGGTPTVLSHLQLKELLALISRNFSIAGAMEFTVEAGRPDTLDQDKLRILKEFGVTRVSVNPQTLNAQTLVRIGRQHTLEELEKAVQLVREVKIPCLNMDMIIGLPGEEEEDWENTLQRLFSYQAENITIHTLAPKRAAAWDFSQIKNKIEEAKVSGWLSQAAQKMQAKGYYPYYLYRQRRSVAGQENIGYTSKGWEGLYNILMMEERSIILGLGGGGMTKWFDRSTLKVTRTPNPKCPATYQGRIQELVAEKVNKLLRSVN